MQYPLFLPAVLPRYLIMVSTFMHHIHETYHYLWNSTTRSMYNMSSSISTNFTGSMNNGSHSSEYSVNLTSLAQVNSSLPPPPLPVAELDIPAALASIIQHKILFSNSCNEAVEMVSQELKNRNFSTSFRSSKGLLPWPPSPYKIIEYWV
jgi:hypothetical protein